MKPRARLSLTQAFCRCVSIGLRSFVLGAGMIVLVVLIASCSGGGGGEGGHVKTDPIDTSGFDSGSVIIGLTDAEGDFLSYTVDVLSLTLTRADGAVVETLPVSCRMDIARYTDITEFLTAATVPAGRYTQACMRLDYSDADIQIEIDGQARTATVQDEQGQELTTVGVCARFSETKALVISPGIPAHLTLDFDLKASHKVDISSDPPMVTVGPVLIADVNPEEPKVHRVRGPLKSTDLEGDSFEVIIRPLHLRLREFGSLTVQVDDETLYEIDGRNYRGRAGLEVLDEKTFGTAMIALGDLNMSTRQFEANEVYAGSSVRGGTLDWVTGNVVARRGEVLNLCGATLVREDGTMIFNDHVNITLGPDTQVTRQAYPGEGLTTEEISPGQRITALGTLQNDQAGLLELDVTEGLVRLLLTTLTGKVVSVGTDSLSMSLQSIDGRRPTLFDFSGTGTTHAEDADPENYAVYGDTLDLGSLRLNDPVKVKGFVRPLGQAPDDFQAKSLMEVSSMEARLHVSWAGHGTPEPFYAMVPEYLAINLHEEDLGNSHHVTRGGVLTDLLDLEQVATLHLGEDRHGLYALCQDETVQTYTVFETFLEGLQEKLDDTHHAKMMMGVGMFEDDLAILTMGRLVVKIEESTGDALP